MKKIIIEIDDKHYEDAINDTEWDTLSLGIYLKEQVKNGKPLEEELENIKEEMQEEHTKHTCFYVNGNHYCDHWGDLQIIDNHIAELKGENNET